MKTLVLLVISVLLLLNSAVLAQQKEAKGWISFTKTSQYSEAKFQNYLLEKLYTNRDTCSTSGGIAYIYFTDARLDSVSIKASTMPAALETELYERITASKPFWKGSGKVIVELPIVIFTYLSCRNYPKTGQLPPLTLLNFGYLLSSSLKYNPSGLHRSSQTQYLAKPLLIGGLYTTRCISE